MLVYNEQAFTSHHTRLVSLCSLLSAALTLCDATSIRFRLPPRRPRPLTAPRIPTGRRCRGENRRYERRRGEAGRGLRRRHDLIRQQSLCMCGRLQNLTARGRLRCASLVGFHLYLFYVLSC